MIKTTKKQFEEYKKWVKYYLNKYGLNDWTVYYSHDYCKNAVAQCRYVILSRGVTFALAEELPDEDYKEIDIRSTARHEVCHLLIADLSALVGRHSTEDEWKRADEAIACRLTNLLEDK